MTEAGAVHAMLLRLKAFLRKGVIGISVAEAGALRVLLKKRVENAYGFDWLKQM